MKHGHLNAPSAALLLSDDERNALDEAAADAIARLLVTPVGNRVLNAIEAAAGNRLDGAAAGLPDGRVFRVSFAFAPDMRARMKATLDTTQGD